MKRMRREQCVPFSIDVGIRYPAVYYKKKWKQVATNYKRVLQKKLALEQAVQQTIASQIQHRVSKYHVLSGLEVEISSIPFFLWTKMMKHWVVYIPKRRKSHFDIYKQTWSGKAFFGSFSKVWKDRMVAPGVTMRITISKQAPAMAMYDSKGERMILTFWYEPFPFPIGWYPTYKCCANAQVMKPKRGYWVERK